MNPRSMFGAYAIITLIALGSAGYGVYLWFADSVEKPDYRVVLSDGAYEIRDYPALIVAELIIDGERWKAVSDGSRPLSAYILAKERRGEGTSGRAASAQRRRPLSRTAPVTQTRSSDRSWTIRFFMPAEYTIETLPEPANPDVRLRRLPAGRLAAVRFSGIATDDKIAAKEKALRQWMAKNAFTPTGPPTYAYYNDPLTPGFGRRNEILFEIPRTTPD